MRKMPRASDRAPSGRLCTCRAHRRLRTCHPAMEDGTAHTRLNPDATERFTPLRRQLGVSSFGMNQIVLQPGQRGRIHRHLRQEEVYLVLEGSLALVIEGDESELSEG